MKLRRRARQILARIVTVSFVTGPVIVFLLERFSLYNRPPDAVMMQELAMVDGVFDGAESSQITLVKNDMELFGPAEVVDDDEEEDQKFLSQHNVSVAIGDDGIVFHNDIEDDPINKHPDQDPIEINVPEEAVTDESIGPGELVLHDRIEEDVGIIYHDRLDPDDTEVIYHNDADVGPAGVVYHDDRGEELPRDNRDPRGPRKTLHQNSAPKTGVVARDENSLLTKHLINRHRGGEQSNIAINQDREADDRQYKTVARKQEYVVGNAEAKSPVQRLHKISDSFVEIGGQGQNELQAKGH